MADFHLVITTGALMQLMMNVGSMFSYSVGPYVSYTTLGVLSAIFPVLYVVLMLVMPESPYFLLMQDRRDEAETTLMRLRGEDNRQDIQVRNLVDSDGCSVWTFHVGYKVARLEWYLNYLISNVSEKSRDIWLFYFRILSDLHFMDPADLCGHPDRLHRAWCVAKFFVTSYAASVVLKGRRHQ